MKLIIRDKQITNFAVNLNKCYKNTLRKKACCYCCYDRISVLPCYRLMILDREGYDIWCNAKLCVEWRLT